MRKCIAFNQITLPRGKTVTHRDLPHWSDASFAGPYNYK